MKDKVLSKSDQSTHLIQIPSCFHAFPVFWDVASAREWDFTAQMFWWCCASWTEHCPRQCSPLARFTN